LHPFRACDQSALSSVPVLRLMSYVTY
jgi:hypothetical protein